MLDETAYHDPSRFVGSRLKPESNAAKSRSDVIACQDLDARLDVFSTLAIR